MPSILAQLRKVKYYLLNLANNKAMDEQEFRHYRGLFIDRLKYFVGDRSILNFSKQIGIPQRTVNQWIKGRSVPNMVSLIDLAKKLDCTVDYLVGLADEY